MTRLTEYEARQLTELEAWQEIGKRIRSRIHPIGICFEISSLGSCELISYSTSKKMEERMQDHKPQGARYYWWPLHDRQSRIKFCNKMIRLCEEEENVEKKQKETQGQTTNTEAGQG